MREQSLNSDTNSTTPQFDDEQTLLSARQVVPLAKIDGWVRRRRGWFLGGEFATAMLLGAASALLASYLKMRNVNPPGVTQVELNPAPPAIEATVSAEPTTIAAPGAEAELPIALETPKKEATTRRKATARPERDYIPSREASGLSEEDELERIRDAVLLDQWEERRLRRADRRERRRAERDNRDLSRVDEIFEGRRRP
jgi:hypothetical protein